MSVNKRIAFSGLMAISLMSSGCFEATLFGPGGGSYVLSNNQINNNTINPTITPVSTATPTPTPTPTPVSGLPQLTPLPTVAIVVTPAAASANPIITATQDMLYDYTPAVTLKPNTYTITNMPSWATFSPVNGRLTGCPTAAGTFANISISGTDANNATQTVGPFTITVAGDPLTSYSWHLQNTGQTGFAETAGVAGQDAKVRETLCSGITGKGILLAVSDTGVQIAHEDLSTNINKTESKNYNVANLANALGGDPEPDIASLGSDAAHGTAVSGILASEIGNGVGNHGIAPNANLAGENFLSYQTLAGVLEDQIMGPYDGVNQSWGAGFASGQPITYTAEDPNYIDAIIAAVTTQRSGLGTDIVKAAGNSFYQDEISVSPALTWRTLPACAEEDNDLPYLIIVGATNATGAKSSYSSVGPCIWVAGMGGEFGYAAPVTGAWPGFGVTFPAIISTDLTGNNGFAALNLTSPPNPFENGTEVVGGVNLNPNTNYTSIMNGTSSATPSVLGTIALMLSVNPKLSWRDVKYILASTADKIQPTMGPTPDPLDPPGYVSNAGWVTNAAGFHYNSWFGFGRVDAENAVGVAQNYTSPLGAFTDLTTSGPNGTWKYLKPVDLAINDNNVTNPTAVDTIAITENIIIEEVNLRITATHPNVADLAIELTAPSGEKSILFQANNALNETNIVNWTLETNAFYGENGQGTWKLTVLDAMAGPAGGGSQFVSQWGINISGYLK